MPAMDMLLDADMLPEIVAAKAALAMFVQSKSVCSMLSSFSIPETEQGSPTFKPEEETGFVPFDAENCLMMADECVEATTTQVLNLLTSPTSTFYQVEKSTSKEMSVAGWHGMQTQEESLLWPPMPEHALGTWRETVQLTSELRLVLTSRRGSRRLRNIEVRSGASLALDLTSDLLVITGSERAIQVAKVEVECLHGVPMSVPAALWAELMRCREQDSDGLLPFLQQTTGTRIHVDRFREEIRVYGQRSSMHSVYETVAELSDRCSEEIISLPPWMSTPAPLMDMIAHKHAVTITVREGAAVLRGLTTAVKEAAEDVRSKALGPPLSLQQLKSRACSETSIKSVSTAISDDGGEDCRAWSDSLSSTGFVSTASFHDVEGDLLGQQPRCPGTGVMRLPLSLHELALDDLCGNSDSSCNGPKDVQFVTLKRRPPGLCVCENEMIHEKMDAATKPRGICYIRFGSFEASCAAPSPGAQSTTIVYE